jgi:hypothetical protein
MNWGKVLIKHFRMKFDLGRMENSWKSVMNAGIVREDDIEAFNLIEMLENY